MLTTLNQKANGYSSSCKMFGGDNAITWWPQVQNTAHGKEWLEWLGQHPMQFEASELNWEISQAFLSMCMRDQSSTTDLVRRKLNEKDKWMFKGEGIGLPLWAAWGKQPPNLPHMTVYLFLEQCQQVKNSPWCPQIDQPQQLLCKGLVPVQCIVKGSPNDNPPYKHYWVEHSW